MYFCVIRASWKHPGWITHANWQRIVTSGSLLHRFPLFLTLADLSLLLCLATLPNIEADPFTFHSAGFPECIGINSGSFHVLENFKYPSRQDIRWIWEARHPLFSSHDCKLSSMEHIFLITRSMCAMQEKRRSLFETKSFPRSWIIRPIEDLISSSSSPQCREPLRRWGIQRFETISEPSTKKLIGNELQPALEALNSDDLQHTSYGPVCLLKASIETRRKCSNRYVLPN